MCAYSGCTGAVLRLALPPATFGADQEPDRESNSQTLKELFGAH